MAKESIEESKAGKPEEFSWAGAAARHATVTILTILQHYYG